MNISSLSLAALIVTSVYASAASAQTLGKVAASNVISVAHRESSVPFSYLVDGRPVGFAVDLTNAIVDEVRRVLQRPALTVRNTSVTAANRMALLMDGSIDLECGSTTNTAARGRDVTFAISHFFAGTRLMVRAGSGIRNFGDLAGQKVATVAGSTNESIVRNFSNTRQLGIQLVLGKDYAEALSLVERGAAVALALDDILLFGLRANASDAAGWEVVGETLQIEPYGCMLRKGDLEFKALVDGTISRLMETGEFARLYEKWFMAPIPPRGVSLNMPMSDSLRANLRVQSDQPAAP